MEGPFNLIREFLKPFVTGSNRMRIPIEENGDEDRQKAGVGHIDSQLFKTRVHND